MCNQKATAVEKPQLPELVWLSAAETKPGFRDITPKVLNGISSFWVLLNPSD